MNLDCVLKQLASMKKVDWSGFKKMNEGWIIFLHYMVGQDKKK